MAIKPSTAADLIALFLDVRADLVQGAQATLPTMPDLEAGLFAMKFKEASVAEEP